MTVNLNKMPPLFDDDVPHTYPDGSYIPVGLTFLLACQEHITTSSSAPPHWNSVDIRDAYFYIHRMPTTISSLLPIILIIGVYLVYKLITKWTSDDTDDDSSYTEPYPHTANAQRPWTYTELLQTREWENFRQYIFSIRGTTCEWCRNPYARPVQVHHKWYFKYRGQMYLPWSYSPDDVMVVCKQCHQAIHRRYQIKTYAKRPYSVI